MKVSNYFVLGAVVFLAACGGSSSSSDGDDNVPTIDETGSIEQTTVLPVDEDDEAFADLQDRVEEFGLLAINSPENFEPTDVASLPAAGTVSYSGIAIINENDLSSGFATENFSTVGEVNLTADFAGLNSVNGTASNFFEITSPAGTPIVDADGVSVAGSLNIALDETSLDSGLLAGSIDGSIGRAAGGSVDINMDALGTFVGDGGSGITIGGGEADGELEREAIIFAN